MLKAVAELTAERLSPHELLVIAHAFNRKGHVGLLLSRIGLIGLIVGRVDIDQLYHKVGVGAGSRYMQVRADWTSDGDIRGQDSRLIHENVRALGGEPLVANHVFLRHPGSRIVNERDWF